MTCVADQLGAVVDPDRAVRTEGAGPDERGDLALLHQALQALPELVDDLLLAGLALGELDHGLLDGDAELLGPGHGAEHRRRLQELLGRDAAAVQAGAADLLLLHHGDVEAGQAAVEGRRVAGGAAADDHDVESLGRRDHLLRSRASAYWPPADSDHGRV